MSSENVTQSTRTTLTSAEVDCYDLFGANFTGELDINMTSFGQDADNRFSRVGIATDYTTTYRKFLQIACTI